MMLEIFVEQLSLRLLQIKKEFGKNVIKSKYKRSSVAEFG